MEGDCLGPINDKLVPNLKRAEPHLALHVRDHVDVARRLADVDFGLGGVDVYLIEWRRVGNSQQQLPDPNERGIPQSTIFCDGNIT